MNKFIGIGNLTKNPEASNTSNGIPVCKFTIAINRRFSNTDGEKETDYFNIVAWRGLAESCSKYLTKGSKVAVTGTVQNRSYEDKEGVKRYITEIIAEDCEFLNKVQSETVATSGELQPIDNDDLPF